MTRLHLRLLGGFRAHLDSGSVVRVPTRKAEALLAYLALPLGQAHPRDKLAGLLWGELPAAQARACLRQTLFRLRRAIPITDSAPLVLQADGIALDPDRVAVDAAAFAQAASIDGADGLERAAALYQGDFL